MAARRNRKRLPGRRTAVLLWPWVVLAGAVAALALGSMLYLRSTRDMATAPVPVAPAARRSAPKQPAPMPKSGRFDFYEMLPKSEVVVPDEPEGARPDATTAPLVTPGIYVLQAGAYSTYAEADRVKAQLALLGISAQIQRIAIEDQPYHRVRIGPIENLEELNRLRRRLRAANIDAMLIRVGE